MAQKPVSLDQMREAIALVAEHGNVAFAARAVGMPDGTFRNRYDKALRAAERGEFGTSPVIPGFRISQTTAVTNEDGDVVREFIQQKPQRGPEFEIPEGHRVKGVSALVDAEGRVVQQWLKTTLGALSTDQIVDSLRDAFADVKPAKLPAKVPSTDRDTVTIYSIVDWHVGLLAWAEETGQNYDLKIAQKVILDAMGRLIASSPPSEQCIILGLGDLLHFDGYEHVTTKSGNFLDGDGRYPKVLRTAARMVIETIDMALQKHKNVLVRMLPGNHDTRSTVAINLALGMRYETHKRVTVDDSAAYMWWYRFGKNLFGATHGDKAKMKELPLVMAHDRPQDWAASTNRRIFTGHLHNERKWEEGGVVVTCMRTPVAKDAYHSFERFRSGRSVYSETYRADGSEAATLQFNL
jgi:hypothetical protein